MGATRNDSEVPVAVLGVMVQGFVMNVTVWRVALRLECHRQPIVWKTDVAPQYGAHDDLSGGDSE